MPVHPTYPGVYVEELQSGVRPVGAVATSTAAFIGAFSRGLLNKAVQLFSMADFEREYGGLALHTTLLGPLDKRASIATATFLIESGSFRVVTLKKL